MSTVVEDTKPSFIGIVQPPISSLEYQIGTVLEFAGPTGNADDPQNLYYKKGEGYGFAEVGGVKCFFHRNDHQNFCGDVNPRFRLELEVNFRRARCRRVPIVNDKLIVLKLGIGRKHDQTNIESWGFSDQMDLAIQWIKSQYRYRLVKVTFVGGEHRTTEVMWEGNHANNTQWRFKADRAESKYLNRSENIGAIQFQTSYFLQYARPPFGEWITCEDIAKVR